MRSENWPDWRVAAEHGLRRDRIRATMPQLARDYVEAQEMIYHLELHIQRVLDDPYFGMAKIPTQHSKRSHKRGKRMDG